MVSNNKIMLEKITKVLKDAYDDGIGYLYTASYLKGIPRNLDREDLSKLSGYMLSNNITVQQVEEFIDQSGVDIFSLIEQLQRGVEEPIGVEMEGDFMEENNIEKVEENIAEKVEAVKTEENIESVEHNQEKTTKNVEQEDDEKRQELTEKAKKLQDKIDLLCDKVEQEKSPLKRHMLTFQIKMLVSKIQKEIDIQNIQAKYEDKRELAGYRKQRKNERLMGDIESLQIDIDYLNNYIKGNEQYDYESENFLYPKEFVESEGGIQEFSEKLKQSKRPSAQIVVNKVEEIASAREELNALNEELKEKQEKLRNSNGDYEKYMNYLNKKENALIKQEKGNIFARMGKFFGAIAEEAKLYRKEKQDLKEIIKKHKEEMNELKKAQNEELKIKKREQKNERYELKYMQKDKIQERISNNVKDIVDTAAAFRSSKVVPPEEMVEETSSQQNEDPVLEVEQESKGPELD